MVKSTSCLKIITCGSDSADKDDLENKGSSDKRGWSFRKRSARHRVLSNTVISETTSSGNKESPESAILDHIPPANSTVPEKISVIQSTDEKPQLSTLENPKVTETAVAAEKDSKFDVNPEEPVVIVIQAAIRGFLGRIMLLKLKNVVKLQAAVRGHLVRSHAVGTLRCVQAIVKMQALVRARYARLSLEGSRPEKKLDGKHEEDNENSKTWEKENLVAKSNATYISIEKLLSNRFARQLLESTPKSKPIHVKCDPSKPNSAWKWLERWMSVSSPNIGESRKAELASDQLEREKDENFVSQIETKVQSEVFLESENVKSSNSESLVPSESEDNLITYDASNFDFQACHPNSSSLKDDLEQHGSDVNDTSLEIIPPPNQSTQEDSDSQVEFNPLPVKPETETEQPKPSMKRFASEELETEGNKFVFGSRKVTSPAFVVAQSKFEELSSTANSDILISSFHQDAGVESPIDTNLPGADTVIRTKELSMAENSAPHSSRVQLQVGGSECGTELSISSTLDSPDISEVGAAECEHEAKVLEEGISNLNSTKIVDVESKDASAIPGSNLSSVVSDQREKPGDVDGEPINSIVAMDSPQIELKLENNASNLQRQLDSERGHEPYRSSPEASPRSHVTVPESHGTPSSQVSAKSKQSKTDKSGSNHKRRSLSGAKKPPNPNNDSGSRSSMEQLPKDQKNGKRRNSFGSPKPDHIEQEPRDASTDNSLPHFMQATESARAKLQANNNSPRSSPDVQDRDLYIKKRHSLPAANGRQGSPRIQRSMSQAQQSTKGNERKWQR
ncbi:protein IQ-DOMAIN 32 isoform X2 [Corylus avellana]|uniref:protein IQ-DOMAIN 32 isoform X2 n=1 Tax=Corylus avellana TaxID=13451 RepID=UPI00286A025A|nr:protein IQ-DOMAIN 32 isoform X2 [Corylus avellana]